MTVDTLLWTIYIAFSLVALAVIALSADILHRRRKAHQLNRKLNARDEPEENQ